MHVWLCSHPQQHWLRHPRSRTRCCSPPDSKCASVPPQALLQTLPRCSHLAHKVESLSTGRWTQTSALRGRRGAGGQPQAASGTGWHSPTSFTVLQQPPGAKASCSPLALFLKPAPSSFAASCTPSGSWWLSAQAHGGKAASRVIKKQPFPPSFPQKLLPTVDHGFRSEVCTQASV